MAHVEIVDQTIRDGPQSLWGMRIRAGMVTKVAPQLRAAGFHTLDVPGGSFFTVMLRHLREDPVAAFAHIRGLLRGQTLRCGTRPSSTGRYGIASYASMDFYTEFMVQRLGIDAFWIYDCLYDMPEMERRARSVHQAGGAVVPAVMYGISPVHTDAWYAARVREMVGWGIASAIYVEDAPGILTPERCRTLIPALVEAAGDVPVELHCHNTTGLAPLNYLIGIEHGIQRIHTASRPVANGPSLPSTEMMLTNLASAGHTHPIDTATLAPVAEHFERVARQEGHPLGVVAEYDRRIYDHQLPGGMTGTFKAQLVEHGMEDRFDAVLEEIPRVRAELGHPVSATPFSQLIGTQAVLNVVSGERYSITTDEVVLYTMGAYGQPPAPIDPDVKDRLLSSPTGRRLDGFQRPDLTLDELRAQSGGPHVSDEDLFRLIFPPQEDLDATAAAGPLRTDYVIHETPAELIRRAMESRHARRISLRGPGMAIDLSR
ncbi:MAG: hypothetical protein R2736_03705 [Solirubrobacterales bacterium]